MNLNNKKWKEFKIKNLFNIKKVFGLPIENYKYGNIPYISTSSNNNGLLDFIYSEKNVLSDKNAISIDPIKGKAFYHKYDFIGRGFSGASINLLYSKNLNQYIALFLCTAIENTSSKKSSYGYLFNSNRLREGKILLPINSKGEPDYEFMENYIKELMDKKRQKFIEYVKKEVNNIKINDSSNLDNKKWKEFKINELFSVTGTITTHPSNLIKDGNIPRITCSATNNGLDNFYKNLPTEKGGVITIDSAAIGFTSYQGYNFIATDHVEKISFKNSKKILVFHGLFIKQLIDKAIDKKYNYGYKFSQSRIKKQIILLPINSKGEPDYEFMENYIKNIMIKKYNNYLKYIENAK